MPIYSHLRPANLDDHTTIAALVADLRRERRWKVRRDRGWLVRLALGTGMAAYSLWYVSWLAAVAVDGAVRLTSRPAASPLSVLVLMALGGLVLYGAFGAVSWVRRLWTWRSATSAAMQRAIDAHEVHEFQVEAAAVVLATGGPGDDLPWYLFDLGDDSALLLHGPEFERTVTFPNHVFVYARAPRGGIVVFKKDLGDRLVPAVSGGCRVKAAYLDSHDLVLEGAFEDICERVLERVPAT